MHVNARKVLLFLVLSFGLSWAIALGFFLSGGRWNTPQAVPVGIAYMFMPMVSALIVQKLIFREPVKEPLGISFRLNRWFLVAWLLPPIVATAAFGVGLLFPGVSYSPDMSGMLERMHSSLSPEQAERLRMQMGAFSAHPFLFALSLGLAAGATFNAIAAFGEELGWRGLLQRELAPLGFWRSSFLIGVIWGLWHMPIILAGHNYPQHPHVGVAMMTLFTALYSPLFAYVRLRARSVIAASILHGTLNGTGGLGIMLLKGGSDLTVGITGAAGLVVLGIANLILWAYARRPTWEPTEE